MGRRFTNWARTHSSVPTSWHEPRALADVADIVRRASAEGRRVKVVGGAHSWSDIALTQDALLSLDALRSVVRVDRVTNRATVEAGMRIRNLNRALASHGLAMSILGSIAEQSVAGAISTGTHGSSLVHGNLSSFVRGLRLVTASGDVVDIGESDERLAAARVGLGALGIIVEVTLQCEPAFRLVEETEAIPAARALESLAAIARSAEYAKLWWLPSTGTVMVFRYRRTTERATVGFGARWFDESVVNRVVFTGLLRAGAAKPAWTHRINALIAKAYFRPTRQIAPSDRLLNIAMPPVHRETEYAVALDQAPEALQAIDAMISARNLRVNFVVEARFTAADDAWMSPAYGRESCFIGAYMAEHADLAAYFEGFEALMRERRGRPHWGKELTSSREYIRSVTPKMDNFIALRREMDPRGTFANAFLDRVLGPA